MAVINTLSSDSLGLRGSDSEYHKISRFFRDRSEALAALDSGDWVPTPGLLNACLIGDEGLSIYDPDGDAELAEEYQIQSGLASGYLFVKEFKTGG